MKNSREFEIAWVGLKPGIHEYQYELNDPFFQAMEAPAEYTDWNVTVKLRFDRQMSFFRLHFDVGGRVTVVCDRCGDPFPLSLWDEFTLLIKLQGEEEPGGREEEHADVVFIPRSESVLQVAEWLYEFSLLSMPIQKIHPTLPDGTPGCNPQALQLLGLLSEPLAEGEEAETDEDNSDKPVDTRWAGLKAFKENKESDETNQN